MKKLLCVVIILITLLFITSCAKDPTPGEVDYYTNKQASYVYEIGEEIILYSKDTNKKVGSLTIKNAFIVEKGDIDVSTNGGTFEANAIVQVNYLYRVNNKDLTIYDKNFTVIDSAKEEGILKSPISKNKYTAYESVLFAIKNTGEYIDITLNDSFSLPIATIRAYYDAGEAEEDPDILKRLIAIFIILTVVSILLIYSFIKKQKKNAEYAEIVSKIESDNTSVPKEQNLNCEETEQDK